MHYYIALCLEVHKGLFPADATEYAASFVELVDDGFVSAPTACVLKIRAGFFSTHHNELPVQAL